MCELGAAQKILPPLNKKVMFLECNNAAFTMNTGTAEATSTVTRREALLVTPPRLIWKDYAIVQVFKHHDHIYTTSAGATLANFTVLTPNEAKERQTCCKRTLEPLDTAPRPRNHRGQPALPW